MPLAKLRGRLEQLCSIYNIRFCETEEANTSCASYLDGDSLPEYGQKPDGWKASGQRIKRGLYRTKNRSLINADLNGSANILFKVARNLDIDLSRLGKRCLTTAPAESNFGLCLSLNSCPKESHAFRRGRVSAT